MNNKIEEIKKNAFDAINNAKKTIENDMKSGGLKNTLKNKYIIAALVLFVVVIVFGFSMGGVPSSVIEEAVFKDAGDQFIVQAGQWSPEIMTLQALGGTIDPAKLVTLDRYEIKNNYTREANNEKHHIYDYLATLKSKSNSKTMDIQGTVYLVKRGDSWYVL